MDSKEQLLRTIEQAAEEGWTKLDLYRSIGFLGALPPDIAKLTDLEELALDLNRLAILPPEIGKLTNLRRLHLSRNQLTMLPPEIGELTNLNELNLSKNQLTMLPPEIGKLTKLEILDVDDNPLTFPPPEIVRQGTHAIVAFLRGQSEASRTQWVSKLLVVGEGGVGKTSLLRALHGKDFDPQLSTTHGIEIETLELEHPRKTDVTMSLRSWDFGGQQIYHATHQFFLTNRSLFLVVWNTRHGYEQGKLYYWLDTIQARAPESPVLLVATHTDERDADLPFKDLREKYPQIRGKCEVSNRTGHGIETLRKAIADEAANLPLMGESWPATWLNAAEAVRAMRDKYITPRELRKVMASQGVPEKDAGILAQWMHDLGDILFFQEHNHDDNKLDDIVILKPQWVSEYISMVLESDEVIENFGLLTLKHRDALWKNLGADIRDHFIRLMERFDLSYRTLENREISLVVERLSSDPPDYEDKWDAILKSGNCREISMKFRVNTIQPGIPTWFIARSHRFTTRTHWRLGALFADKQNKHFALVQAFPHDRYIRLSVRGPCPHNFFVLLKDGLGLTFNRFPGLNIECLIPCPGHDGKACPHEFEYKDLEKRIERDPPKFFIECPKSLEDMDVRSLVFGLRPIALDEAHRELEELARKTEERKEDIIEYCRELLTLLQRQFTNDFRREQSKIESHCPSVFVLRPAESSSWRKIFSQKIELQLYCDYPGRWHPTREGGRYEIDHSAEWLKKMGSHIKNLVSLLKIVSPFIGPWVGMADLEYQNLIKNDIKFMEELVKAMPNIRTDEYSLDGTNEPGRAHGPTLRALRQILNEKDPQQDWGGLRKVLTPEGHYLWLCEHHATLFFRGE